MNLTTVSLTDENPDPTPSTATDGMNEPGTPLDAWIAEMLADAGRVPFQRISKHRAGRTRKLSPERKARKHRAEARLVQLRKRQFLDARVLLGAVSD